MGVMSFSSFLTVLIDRERWQCNGCLPFIFGRADVDLSLLFQNRDLALMTEILVFEECGGTQGMDDLKRNGSYGSLRNYS